jgi:hypothetical protein
MHVAGDYNHALELDTRGAKKDGAHSSARRFSSSHSSPSRSLPMSSNVMPSDNVHVELKDGPPSVSVSASEGLIKANFIPRERQITPNDSCLRASACGSIDSLSRQVSTAGQEDEAALEVRQSKLELRGRGANNGPAQGLVGCTASGEQDDTSSLQLIGRLLAEGYRNRKKACFCIPGY